MQANIHPQGYQARLVTCSGCGNQFEINTLHPKDVAIEMCHRCHPAYTGKRKVAKAGAIEKFNEKYGDGFASMMDDD